MGFVATIFSLLCLCLCCCLVLCGGATQRLSGGGDTHSHSHSHSHSYSHSGDTTTSGSGTNCNWPAFLYTRTQPKCTPQYWSSGSEAWPNIVPKEAAISKVFGSRALQRYEPGLTLFHATLRNDDVGGTAYAKLIKHATAALLNAYARDGFPFHSWEVKVLLLESLVSEEAAAAQAERFEQANLSCP